MDHVPDQALAIVEPDGQLCHLYHPMFARMGEVVFRRAESDATPVMVVSLGDRQAALPLRSLQREFQIGDDTPDSALDAMDRAGVRGVRANLEMAGIRDPGRARPLQPV